MKNTLKNAHLEGDSFFWEGGPVGVLLSHGYTATAAEVRLVAKALHEQGYTVSGPLLPGHGTTPQELNRCRWQEWVAAIEDAYQRLAQRCEHVFVGGESMGGLLVLYTASHHPEIAGVLTYSTALKIQDSVAEKAVPLIHPFIPILERDDDEPPNEASPRWQGYPVQPLHALNEMLKLQSVVGDRLSRIAQPILIMQGRLDTAVAAEAPQMIYEGVNSEDKRLHWLEKSTHCLLLDQEWKKVAELTSEFIADVLP
jgi:carboxylesterase